MGSESSLTNHLLVAMPSLADPNFAQTVTLICEHSVERGALGIVVNKPLPMKLAEDREHYLDGMRRAGLK